MRRPVTTTRYLSHGTYRYIGTPDVINTCFLDFFVDFIFVQAVKDLFFRDFHLEYREFYLIFTSDHPSLYLDRDGTIGYSNGGHLLVTVGVFEQRVFYRYLAYGVDHYTLLRDIDFESLVELSPASISLGSDIELTSFYEFF